jgi:cytoskeletal protein CcmA (bactofilin family)
MSIKIFRGQHKGNWTIDTPTVIHGQVTGDVTVLAGISVVLHGQVNGDLTVEENAKAELHGMVNGAVRNQGGHVILYGWADEVFDTNGAETRLSPGCKVRGKGGGPLA